MRIPFWPRRRPTELVVTFTQRIDLEALAAGTPGVFGEGVDLVVAVTCDCGATMSGNYPFVITRPNSVTRAHVCPDCGSKTNIVYTYDAALGWTPPSEQEPG